jgi:lipid-A-disaccharide synthase
VAYRLSPLTYALLRVLVKVKAVALPNLLLGEFAVPELLQAEADSRNLSQALLNLLADAGIRERLAARFALLHQMLRPDAAHSAAEAVLSLLEARA